MADNVAITAGTGTAIHADEYTHATLGAGKTQLVKLVDGTLDSGTAIAAGGGVEAGALRVTIASDSTGVLSVDDNGGALTVDGTVTANLSATDNAVLDQIELNTDPLLVVGSGTEATAIRVTLASDSTGVVSVDDNGGALTVDGTVAVTNAGITTIAGAVAGTEMQVDVLTMPSTAVTNAGTFVTQENGALLTAAQLVDDVVYVDDADWTDSTSKHALVGGLYQSTPQTVTDGDVAPFNITANGALHVSDAGGSLTVDGTITEASGAAIKTAVETIDNAISGSEMQVDVVGALPAGTNAIGKLTSNSGVDIGDVTLTAGTDAIGKLLPPDVDVTAHTNYAKKYYTNAGAVTDGIIWSPAAGKRWHVVSLTLNVSAAATVTLEDDKAGGDEAVMKFELAANSGVVIPFGEKYPLASGEDAADLLVTTTAGNVYITCVGYEV